MNYSVLARKWRPKSLQEMVGQEHILTIIANSIQQNRVHHAYLFCGTRGVGKTTLARIFTKCLNCEKGPTATPCNQCNTCLQIDKGIYPDLIEIDAASRTKVEDTRELLDNIQYTPSSGKYKVYLIDEVHMLSGHSFNALLKTLEEPPDHVKFLLATTDPQKLPITVLSRCLKLTLKMLTITQISTHLASILTSEKITFEPAALMEIAQAAQGSMRDGLSLLDQIIVFCDQHITLEKVCQLLGTEAKHLNIALLHAVIEKQDETVFSLIQNMEEKGGDFLRITDDLLHLLHQIALYKKNTRLIAQHDSSLIDAIISLNKKLTAEDIQLLYQITLAGKRDLPFAPTSKIGFEILVLRAMDFYPLNISEKFTPNIDQTRATAGNSYKDTSQDRLLSAASWSNIVAELNLKGITLSIASQASIGKISNSRLDLTVPERLRSLCNDKQQQLLSDALTQYLSSPVVVSFYFTEQAAETVAEEPKVKQEDSKGGIKQDPNITQLLDMFDANIQKQQ